jgi:hypothetical protein
VVAIASDCPVPGAVEHGLAQLDLNDAAKIAQFIIDLAQER